MTSEHRECSAPSEHRRKSLYRIVSLDGGGIRGYLQALLLARLFRERPSIFNDVALLAGTSTGAIIALGLAVGMDPSAIAEIYVRHAPRIFDVPFGSWITDFGGLTGARYSGRRLSAVLRGVFGERRLGELARRVLIPAFCLDNQDTDPDRRHWEPRFFHNGALQGAHERLAVWRVAFYSCLVPGVFPVVDGYVDGGVFASNPAMCALAHSQDPSVSPSVPQFDEIRMLSFGSGRVPVHVAGQNLNWGLMQWAKPLLGVTLDAAVNVVVFQCRQFLRDHFYRVDPVVPGQPPIQLDDIGAFSRLKEVAESVSLAPILNWLDLYW